jgi:hypothetical protein
MASNTQRAKKDRFDMLSPENRKGDRQKLFTVAS